MSTLKNIDWAIGNPRICYKNFEAKGNADGISKTQVKVILKVAAVALAVGLLTAVTGGLFALGICTTSLLALGSTTLAGYTSFSYLNRNSLAQEKAQMSWTNVVSGVKNRAQGAPSLTGKITIWYDSIAQKIADGINKVS